MFEIEIGWGGENFVLSIEEAEEKFGKQTFQIECVYHNKLHIYPQDDKAKEYVLMCVLREMAKDWLRDNDLFCWFD